MLFAYLPSSPARALSTLLFPAGCAGLLLLLLTGCAPKIHTASQDTLQALDSTSLAPVVGCYRYLSSSQTCINCGSAPFFPFGEAAPDGPKTASELRDPPDTVCLRAYEDGHVITATSYRSGVAVRSQSYEGRAREDGYFVLRSTTSVDLTSAIVFWVLQQSRSALGVDESGALRQVEIRSGALFFVFMPVFGSDFGASARFEPAPNPRAAAAPDPQGNDARDSFHLQP